MILKVIWINTVIVHCNRKVWMRGKKKVVMKQQEWRRKRKAMKKCTYVWNLIYIKLCDICNISLFIYFLSKNRRYSIKCIAYFILMLLRKCVFHKVHTIFILHYEDLHLNINLCTCTSMSGFQSLAN